MKASAANFLTLIKGPKQFVIPIYQRTYSWQKSQCDQLLKDILRISQDNSTPGHFIGSIVYFQESIHTQTDVPQLLVIDGQQRLTTVSLLIAAVANFIDTNNIELETTATKLRNYYLLNAEEDGDLRFKLLLTRRDKSTLIDLLKGNPFGPNLSPRVAENYQSFYDYLTAANVVDVYNGILRLFVVDVALERDKDNPQLIFESLNSTGLDLSEADLIRNYILMGQPVDLQTQLYEHYWYPMEQAFGNDYSSRFDWFVRDYLSVRTGKIPKIGHVYEAFKGYLQTGTEGRDIVAVLNDLYEYAKYYVRIALNAEDDPELAAALKNISRLKVDVSYPFLLPLYADYASGDLPKNDLGRILALIESYVFRRAICGIPTNSLNKTFANLYRSVVKDRYVESIEAAFMLMDGYQRFPNDSEFDSELKAKDVYNLRARNYLLSKLENFGRKEPVIIDEYTIEHIMPQNPNLSSAWKEMLGEDWKNIQEKYLHKIGNLTLTGYNSELSDRPFTEKKSMPGGFNDSPIRLNAGLRTISLWNEETISHRAAEIATLAKKVWPAPELPEDVIATYRKQEAPSPITYTLADYKHLEGEMMALYEHLQRRITNLGPSVKEEFTKLYIAFRTTSNFIEIVPQKSRLKLYLNIDFDDLVDPVGMARDVSGIGSWGSGDVEVGLSKVAELEAVMELVQQAFDAQTEGV